MGRRIEPSLMSHTQLMLRIYAISRELQAGITTEADYRRFKAIPSELRAIADELTVRGGAQLRFPGYEGGGPSSM